jgi:hypothetical protein
VKCYIKENAWLAKMAARKMKQDKMAMVMGKTILLYNTTTAEFLANKRWVRHELMHVKQFQQHGYILFLWRYLIDWVKNGYYNNKFEKEAREAETDISIDLEYSF